MSASLKSVFLSPLTTTIPPPSQAKSFLFITISHQSPEAESVIETMTSHKRPLTLSPEETYLDECERVTQDPFKRVAFERKFIEDELKDEKRVIFLQETPSSSIHCRFWDCVPSELLRKPNIRSAFRLNVKDLSGRCYGSSSQFFQNRTSYLELNEL